MMFRFERGGATHVVHIIIILIKYDLSEEGEMNKRQDDDLPEK